MKTTLRKFAGATLLGFALVTGPMAVAQTSMESSTTTTTSAGTISEFSPDTIVVRSETASAPVRYRYTKSTTYVDDSGAPVSMETVKSGLPVTVYYTKDGDNMVASKVIVRKSVSSAPSTVEERKTTTTTTTEDK